MLSISFTTGALYFPFQDSGHRSGGSDTQVSVPVVKACVYVEVTSDCWAMLSPIHEYASNARAASMAAGADALAVNSAWTYPSSVTRSPRKTHLALSFLSGWSFGNSAFSHPEAQPYVRSGTLCLLAKLSCGLGSFHGLN